MPNDAPRSPQCLACAFADFHRKQTAAMSPEKRATYADAGIGLVGFAEAIAALSSERATPFCPEHAGDASKALEGMGIRHALRFVGLIGAASPAGAVS